MLSLRASEGGSLSLSKKIQLNVHLQSVPYHGSSVAYILVAHSSFNIELPGGPSVLQRNSGVKVKSFTNPISSEQSFAKASSLPGLNNAISESVTARPSHGV